MKTGDKVRIMTTAGARRVNEKGELIGSSCSYNQPAIIVAMGCGLPTFFSRPRPTNNTIVQLCDTKELIFTHTNNLDPIDKKIELRYFVDGVDKTDSISDETKRNLRNQ